MESSCLEGEYYPIEPLHWAINMISVVHEFYHQSSFMDGLLSSVDYLLVRDVFSISIFFAMVFVSKILFFMSIVFSCLFQLHFFF